MKPAPFVPLPSDAELLDKLGRIWAAGAEQEGRQEDGRRVYRRLAMLAAVRDADEGYPDVRRLIADSPEPGPPGGGRVRPRVEVVR